MKKIVCFEDLEKDCERLKEIFRNDADLHFFKNPDPEWKVTEEQIEAIALFDPHFAIVDMKDDITGLEIAGERIIRKLRDSNKTRHIPIIVWTMTLQKGGKKLEKRIERLGAIPFLKNRRYLPSAEEFFKKAGL